MAAMRIARTVTGRNTIVLFTGSYHGIFDEVIVRGTQEAARRVPAAPGILRNTARARARAGLRHARIAADHPRARATSWPPCWSSRCRAAVPTSSRVEFLQRAARQITSEAGALPDLRRGRSPASARTRAARRRCSASRPTSPPTARSSAAACPIGVDRRQARPTWTRSTAAHWQYGDDSIPTVGRHLLRRHLRAPSARAGRGQGLARST